MEHNFFLSQQNLLERMEEEVSVFFETEPVNSIYRSCLPSGFQRLLLHATAQYLNLVCKSKSTIDLSCTVWSTLFFTICLIQLFLFLFLPLFPPLYLYHVFCLLFHYYYYTSIEHFITMYHRACTMYHLRTL